MECVRYGLMVGCCWLLGLCAVGFVACLASRGCRAILRRFRHAPLAVLAVVAILHGGTKDIKAKSAADEGVAVLAATITATNGLAKLEVSATGGWPCPGWWRESVTNEWTALADDGWTMTVSNQVETSYFAAWERDDTNGLEHAMWYFGANPPGITIEQSGGVTVTNAVFSGNAAYFAWMVDDTVARSPSDVFTVSVRASASLPWQTVLVTADEHATVTGFWIDRYTEWRVSLEVPR